MYEYGSAYLADFHVVRDYANKAPWMLRNKNKNVSYWQKIILHLEYAPCDEDELCNRCHCASKMLYLKKHFGGNSWFFENPGDKVSEGEKASFGKMIAQHESINLSTGVVGLKWLVDSDVNVELNVQPRVDGTEKRPITRSV